MSVYPDIQQQIREAEARRESARQAESDRLATERRNQLEMQQAETDLRKLRSLEAQRQLQDSISESKRLADMNITAVAALVERVTAHDIDGMLRAYDSVSASWQALYDHNRGAADFFNNNGLFEHFSWGIQAGPALLVALKGTEGQEAAIRRGMASIILNQLITVGSDYEPALQTKRAVYQALVRGGF
jgi:hypothetical protein